MSLVLPRTACNPRPVWVGTAAVRAAPCSGIPAPGTGVMGSGGPGAPHSVAAARGVVLPRPRTSSVSRCRTSRCSCWRSSTSGVHHQVALPSVSWRHRLDHATALRVHAPHGLVHARCRLDHAMSTLVPAVVVFAAEEIRAWGVVRAAVGYAAVDVGAPAISSPVVSAVDCLVVSSVVVPVASSVAVPVVSLVICYVDVPVASAVDCPVVSSVVGSLYHLLASSQSLASPEDTQ